MDHAARAGVDVEWFTVRCSPELKVIVSDNFIHGGTFTDPKQPLVILPIQGESQLEVQCYHQTQEFEPMHYIDLDLIVNPETFWAEYVRVAELMNVEVQDQAMIMDYYSTWRSERFVGMNF